MSFARDKQRKGISFAVLSGGFSAGEARLTVELYIEGGRPLRERRGGISKVLPPSLPPPPPPPSHLYTEYNGEIAPSARDFPDFTAEMKRAVHKKIRARTDTPDGGGSGGGGAAVRVAARHTHTSLERS